ncbi:hypothetical protein Tco_0341407 [Tanacetum coccineum]
MLISNIFADTFPNNYRTSNPRWVLRAIVPSARLSAIVTMGGYQFSQDMTDSTEFVELVVVDVYGFEKSTDIAKISRKRLKPGKLRHGNGRARKKPGECYQRSKIQPVGKMSPSTLIGGDPRKNDTVDMKEAQGNKAYTLEVLTKEARHVTITDCHTGNTCELEIDLTAKSSSPIIERMYGQDWKERAET